MSKVSELEDIIDNINKYLPPNKRISWHRFPLKNGSCYSKKEYGYSYAIYAELHSLADNKTVISQKEIMSGSLRDCKTYLDGMITILKIITLK